MRFALPLFLCLLVGCAGTPTAPAGPGGPALVTLNSVDVRAGHAHVVWSARPGVVGTLLVQRRLGAAPWKGLAYVAVDREWRLVLDDDSVQPGAAYTYRVRVTAEPTPLYAGEVTIEVPAR